MHIFIKTFLKKANIYLEVVESDTIKDVKTKVLDVLRIREYILLDRVQMFYGVKKLSSDYTINDYCIPNNSTLTLVLFGLHGGMKISVKTPTDETLKLNMNLTESSITNVKINVDLGNPATDYKIMLNGNGSSFNFNIVPRAENKQIFLELGSEIISLGIDEHDTVDYLKYVIYKRTGYNPDLQKIVFNGNLLEENRILADYNIQEKSLLKLYLTVYDPVINSAVNIKILIHDGFETMPIYMEPSDTVHSLKAKLHLEKGLFPPNKQLLIFRNKILDEEQTLSENGIKNNSELFLCYNAKCIAADNGYDENK